MSSQWMQQVPSNLIHHYRDYIQLLAQNAANGQITRMIQQNAAALYTQTGIVINQVVTSPATKTAIAGTATDALVAGGAARWTATRLITHAVKAFLTPQALTGFAIILVLVGLFYLAMKAEEERLKALGQNDQSPEINQLNIAYSAFINDPIYGPLKALETGDPPPGAIISRNRLLV